MNANCRRALEERTKHGDRLGRQMKRIDILPDDVLLEIFDFCTNAPILRSPIRKKDIEAWLSLIHVCRRWRILVFASPRRLNLKLCCTPKTPVKDKLDIWPALPLVVMGARYSHVLNTKNMKGWDNVIAALGHSNRIREVYLCGLTNKKLEQVSAAMQVPFPELTELDVFADCYTPPVIPDLFLGGSAPRLQSFSWSGIPYPGLPNLLLSATHLVSLWLSEIPYIGYISPEAIVATLSVLSRLRILHLEFESLPELETRHPPPSKRSVLPALSCFTFKGTTEYLEDFLSRIDSPQLENLFIEFFDEIDLDFPLLVQFIDRTPMLKAPDEATITFGDCTTNVLYRMLHIEIKCEPDQQVLSIAQACSTSITSTVEDLFIERRRSQLDLKKEVNNAVENTLWLQLLLPFTAVKDLYLFKDFAPAIAATLQGLVGDEITEVLPNLQNIFVEDLDPLAFEEIIGKFVVTRRLSGYPVAISDWDRESSDQEKDPSDWDDYSDPDSDPDVDLI